LMSLLTSVRSDLMSLLTSERSDPRSSLSSVRSDPRSSLNSVRRERMSSFSSVRKESILRISHANAPAKLSRIPSPVSRVVNISADMCIPPLSRHLLLLTTLSFNVGAMTEVDTSGGAGLWSREGMWKNPLLSLREQSQGVMGRCRTSSDSRDHIPCDRVSEFLCCGTQRGESSDHIVAGVNRRSSI